MRVRPRMMAGSVIRVYIPVFMTVTMASIALYQAGKPLTNAVYLMLNTCCYESVSSRAAAWLR